MEFVIAAVAWLVIGFLSARGAAYLENKNFFDGEHVTVGLLWWIFIGGPIFPLAFIMACLFALLGVLSDIIKEKQFGSRMFGLKEK